MHIAKTLTADELRELNVGPGRLPVGIVLTFAGITAVFALVYATRDLASKPLELATLSFAFVAIGWLQFVVVQGLHEATHQVLGRKGFASSLVALTMVYPLGLTRQFRGQHLAHHRYFGDPERDPDYSDYATFPRTRWVLLRRLLWSASGAPAVASFFRKSSDHQGLEAEGTTSAGELLKLVAVQAGVALALSAVFSPLHYLLLWALPLLTIAKLCTVLRLLCEHSSPDKPYVWRTFAGNALERNLLGSFGLNYHAEHHIYPTVPYENLPTVFALYSERLPAEGRGDLYEVYEGGHLGLLRDWFRALPWRGGVTASDS